MNIIKTIIILLFAGLMSVTSGDAQVRKNPCLACEELKNLQLPDITISQSEIVDEGEPYCKVIGTMGKEINFELLLPNHWNNRFVMGGGGGFVGNVQNVARWKVKEGYATSGTDTGHKGHGLTADWAYHNMERQVNFGHLAVHRTAVVSKAIINQYYCSFPEYSYFIGCSRGGGQAMMEAQRYPEDFNGIVSGAPAFDWPGTAAEFIQNIQNIYPDPNNLEEPIISRANLQLLQTIVLEQCDAIDGLKDQILNDPRDCNIDFDSFPICNTNSARDECFTQVQIKAIKSVYDGIINEGKMIYPGFPFGGENEPGGWFEWIVGPNQSTMQLNFPSLQFGFGTEMLKYLVFQDPDFDYSSYDFSNYLDVTQYASSYLNATSTDYSGLKNRKGKMIIYHGWNDPALSALSTIEHYDNAKNADKEIEDYIRLYLLPGVLHCGGGPGPHEVDWLELVREWVENDKAPERVILSKSVDGKKIMTRPVFPYPQKAVYDGKGNPNKESNFKSTISNK